MKKNHREIPEKEFPELFPKDFLIECEDGWTELIRLVCKAFKKHLENNEIEKIQFLQVKEKFAQLRIYYDIKYYP